jgi:hypothetical protein
MKRFFIVMIALMTTMQAQAGLLPSLKWGVKGGMDYQVNNFQSAVESIDIKSNTGWYAGAHATLNWGMLGIRPELIYSQNNFNLEGIDGTIKMNKVDLPLLLELRFLGLLSLHAGPTFNIMNNTSGTSEGAQWDIKRPTIGYAAGVEVEIWKIAISARYNGAFEESEVLGYTTGENKISTIQIGIGFNF